MGGHATPQPIKVDIGTREIVGFGNNGEHNYMDDPHYPFPAIRFQEDTTGNIAVSKQQAIKISPLNTVILKFFKFTSYR